MTSRILNSRLISKRGGRRRLAPGRGQSRGGIKRRRHWEERFEMQTKSSTLLKSSAPKALRSAFPIPRSLLRRTTFWHPHDEKSPWGSTSRRFLPDRSGWTVIAQWLCVFRGPRRGFKTETPFRPCYGTDGRVPSTLPNSNTPLPPTGHHRTPRPETYVPGAPSKVLLATSRTRCRIPCVRVKDLRYKSSETSKTHQLFGIVPSHTAAGQPDIDILRWLSKMKVWQRFFFVITDGFTKITQFVALRAIIALTVAVAFCDAWVSSMASRTLCYP